MKCKNCGKEIEENTIFCKFCGAKQEQPTVVSKKQIKLDKYGIIIMEPDEKLSLLSMKRSEYDLAMKKLQRLVKRREKGKISDELFELKIKDVVPVINETILKNRKRKEKRQSRKFGKTESTEIESYSVENVNSVENKSNEEQKIIRNLMEVIEGQTMVIENILLHIEMLEDITGTNEIIPTAKTAIEQTRDANETNREYLDLLGNKYTSVTDVKPSFECDFDFTELR